MNLIEQKKSWILLAALCIILNISALFMQYVYHIEPCVICVQQRALLFLISIVSLIAIPFKLKKTSILFLGLDIIILLKVIILAIKKINIQLHPYLSTTCLIEKPFPSFLPLDKWIPSVFLNKGYCSSSDISIFGLSLSQILLIICLAIIVPLISVFVMKFYKPSKK